MGIKVSNTCEVTFGDPASAAASRQGWLLGEVHDGIAQMFQVIENARMMVGTKAIATLSTGYLNALDYAKEPRPGRRPHPGLRQDRAARDDHPPPRRTPLADDAEVVRRGACARWCSTPRRGRTGCMIAEHNGETRRARRAGQRPAAADREGLRLGALVGAARHRVAADLRRLRASCRTTRSSSTSATPRSTPSTRAPRRSRARTCSSARSSRTRRRRSATSPSEIEAFIDERGRQRPAQGRARAARHRRSRTPRRSSAR